MCDCISLSTMCYLKGRDVLCIQYYHPKKLVLILIHWLVAGLTRL